MSIFADLNSYRVRDSNITIPYNGAWTADVLLDQTVTLPPSVLLTVGGLQLRGHVYRQGFFTGSTACRIIGGYGGWLKQLPFKEYRSSFGIKFSVVAGDVARECGESVSISSDFTIGQYYPRQAAVASRVLNTFAPLWWMRQDGVTVIGSRASTIISSAFDVMSDDIDMAKGKIVVATDRPEDWRPGYKFGSPLISERTISGVIHRLTKDKLRTEVWAQ